MATTKVIDNNRPAEDAGAPVEGSALPLHRANFIGMIVAGVMIVAGFLLMLGSPSGTDTFNYDIFSTRRIVVGPAIAFLGFVAMAVAIIISPRKKKEA
ncbi:MAG: DUF3098 domain-containing protein [Muribaculaceae bacterium]|nr:DUF3098 domain-containing protein [Muribaculaceae bacterium]